jgi:hypothetical protein
MPASTVTCVGGFVYRILDNEEYRLKNRSDGGGHGSIEDLRQKEFELAAIMGRPDPKP